MAKANKAVESNEPYSLSWVQSEIDVLWVLWHVAIKNDPKLLKQVVSKMRAKMGHKFPPRIFNNILKAKDPALVIETITENYLAKPAAEEIDLTKHGVCQVKMIGADGYVNEYIHVDFGTDRADILHAQQYELQILERCAIQATEACGLNYAVVNVTLYKDHGFSGQTHQFVVGDAEQALKLGYSLEDL